QNCVNLGRTERGRATAKRRDPLQSDIDVFAVASGARGRSERATDLAVCRSDLRLVQKGDEARFHRVGRSRRATSARDSHVLYKMRHPDRSDGGEFSERWTDSGTGGMRLPDDQPRADG